MSVDSGNNEIVDICSEPITICVRDQHGEETHFKLNKTANMELVFDTYAKRKGIQTTDSIRFLLHNEEIRPNQTPNKLQLKDDDKIDCVVPTPAPITIRIRDQYGEETHFKLPETMKMQKVFNAYMKHKWICRWYHICFELNGVEIGPDQTPKTLELKDHDIVYFVTKPHVLDSTPITIRLRELREGECVDFVFRIKKCTPMKRVFDTFAVHKGMHVSSFRFLWCGEKVHGDDTPQMLDLDEQDQIDVMVEQSGS